VLITGHLDHPKWSANDNASGSGAMIEAARALQALITAKKLDPVFFDYDKAELRPDGAQMLARAAQMIKQKGWHVQIEGNCDERGSTEYNLSLGEHRADSARQALLQGGVSADAIKTISYGKEKPQCTESNEDCWQRNRRDHFTLLH